MFSPIGTPRQWIHLSDGRLWVDAIHSIRDCCAVTFRGHLHCNKASLVQPFWHLHHDTGRRVIQNCRWLIVNLDTHILGNTPFARCEVRTRNTDLVATFETPFGGCDAQDDWCWAVCERTVRYTLTEDRGMNSHVTNLSGTVLHIQGSCCGRQSSPVALDSSGWLVA